MNSGLDRKCFQLDSHRSSSRNQVWSPLVQFNLVCTTIQFGPMCSGFSCYLEGPTIQKGNHQRSSTKKSNSLKCTNVTVCNIQPYHMVSLTTIREGSRGPQPENVIGSGQTSPSVKISIYFFNMPWTLKLQPFLNRYLPRRTAYNAALVLWICAINVQTS